MEDTEGSIQESKLNAVMAEEIGASMEAKLSRHGLPLVPQPSDDPFDPLNWSKLQKGLILGVLCLWVIVGTTHMIAVAPAFEIIAQDLNCSINNVTYLVGAPLLAYGVASLIWVAVGNTVGVRTVFVTTSLACGLCCIWGAKATSFASLVAARTLASIFSASPETLGPQAIGDVFFLHDRARSMALYVLFQASGFAMGSLIGAYITANLGWRWIQWILAIASLVICLLLFLFHPETQYTRASIDKHARQRRLIDSLRFWSVSGGGKSKVENLGRALLYPFRYFPHPAVIIMTFYFSMMLLATSYMLTSNSFIYGGIYGFGLKSVGLTSFAPLIAVWLAIPYAGVLNDYFVERLRRKSNFKPEWRLGFFSLTAVLAPVGCIVVGVCAQNKDRWITPLIGEALLMFAFVTANSLVQTYLVDIYEARADATLVILNGFKNLAAFGISYAIVPWNMSAGYAVPFGVLAAIVFAAHIPVFVLWWKGEQIRAWSARVWDEAKPSHHGDTF